MRAFKLNSGLDMKLPLKALPYIGSQNFRIVGDDGKGISMSAGLTGDPAVFTNSTAEQIVNSVNLKPALLAVKRWQLASETTPKPHKEHREQDDSFEAMTEALSNLDLSWLIDNVI